MIKRITELAKTRRLYWCNSSKNHCDSNDAALVCGLVVDWVFHIRCPKQNEYQGKEWVNLSEWSRSLAFQRHQWELEPLRRHRWQFFSGDNRHVALQHTTLPSSLSSETIPAGISAYSCKILVPIVHFKLCSAIEQSKFPTTRTPSFTPCREVD